MSQQELEDITVSTHKDDFFSFRQQKAIQASLADMELAKNTVSAEEAEINRAIALSLEVMIRSEVTLVILSKGRETEDAERTTTI
jgi:hypothetical protein